MKKIITSVVVAAMMLGGFAFLAPTAEAAGNGIQTGEFLYMYESDPDLAAACAADQAPEFVVLNIGNGSTNDVGHLDSIAQTCIANGSKTLGYVHIVDSLDEDADSNTTEFRTDTKVAEDVARWVNPFNPQRTVGGQFVKGIMFDQAPSTCGASNVNVTWMSYLTTIVDNQFAFWSYPTPLVMANAGTAISDCLPGYAYYGRVPDRWITFEGTYATYASSYLGGNVTNGSSYYNGENTFGQQRFVHIVYDADASEMETALRLADDRGAAFLAATDDTTPNPYDTRASYADDSTRLAATPRVIFDEGYQTGVQAGYTGTPSAPWVVQIDLDDNTQNRGDSPFVDRFEALVLQECYVDISTTNAYSGDVGSSVDTRGTSGGFEGWDLSYSALDTNFVTCVKDMIQPGSNPNDHGLTICNDIVNTTNPPTVTDYDCLATDGDITTENVNEQLTTFIQGMLDTNAEVAEFIVLIRDRDVEDGNTGGGGANCINNAGERCLEPANPAPGGLGQWRQPDTIIMRAGFTAGIAITGFEFGWQTTAGSFSNP